MKNKSMLEIMFPGSTKQLGTKEEFELSQRLRELKLNSNRAEFEELRDEDINLDNQE